MNEVKFAILGCGKIGSRHAEKLQKVGGARLVAVCDVISERAETIAKKHGVVAYNQIEDLLKDEAVDFVNVCTPSGFHPEHSIAALNAKKNVLCEKPMAFTEKDARAMIDAAYKNQKFLYVVKQNRFNPPVKLVLKLLHERKLGKPIKCVVNMFWNRGEDYYRADAWRGTRLLDGGALFTQASHFVDLMLEFMGSPKSVYALMGTYKQNIETEDTGVIAVEFLNGAIGSFNYTTCATHKNFEGSITLIGTEGTVKIGGEYLNTIEQFQVNGVKTYELEEGAGANDYGTYKGSMSNHDKVFEGVVEAIQKGDHSNRFLALDDHAIQAVRFMERAVESAQRREKVSFA